MWRTTETAAPAAVTESISIHVPRVEDDVSVCFHSFIQRRFQSTSPVWRTTQPFCRRYDPHTISIHVPRVEDDSPVDYDQTVPTDFNPRPPCGGRRQRLTERNGLTLYFNPRPPCGGRLHQGRQTILRRYFNPRPPCGGRHRFPFDFFGGIKKFQSTSPVWRTTSSNGDFLRLSSDFNPRPPCGGRRSKKSWKRKKDNFNPRPPCGGRQRRW